MTGAREAFTHSLMLEYKWHFMSETFEVMPLEGETDIILPIGGWRNINLASSGESLRR
jgi:hypothetical protein